MPHTTAAAGFPTQMRNARGKDQTRERESKLECKIVVVGWRVKQWQSNSLFKQKTEH